MGKFTAFMNSHFASSGCRLIARAHDKCRNRNVSIYALPGYWDCVGVSDGTDAWIAPASAGLFFGTATGDCADLMRRLQAGEELPPIPDPPPNALRRPRIALLDEEPRRARVIPVDDDITTPRRTRRALLT